MTHGMKREPIEDFCHSFVTGTVEVESKFICTAMQCHWEGPRSSDQGPCTAEAYMTHGMKHKRMEDACHSFVTGVVEV